MNEKIRERETESVFHPNHGAIHIQDMSTEQVEEMVDALDRRINELQERERELDREITSAISAREYYHSLWLDRKGAKTSA